MGKLKGRKYKNALIRIRIVLKIPDVTVGMHQYQVYRAMAVREWQLAGLHR